MEAEKATMTEKDRSPAPTEYKNMSLCQRVKYVKSHVTVEVTGFLVIFANVLQGVAMQTMGLEKACRVNLGLDDEICDALRAQDGAEDLLPYERMVQELYASQVSWRSILQTILPCIVVIFVGGWSDATGRRKVIMLACLSGEIAHTLNNIINVIFFYQIRLEIYIFFDVFSLSIVGGTGVMFLALMNYICDITTPENRTHRIGFVNLSTFASMPLALSISGIVLNYGGYYGIFIPALVLHLINLFYLIFYISDQARTEEHKKHDGRGVIHFLRTFFNLGTIKETLAIVWKKTENNRRKTLLILIGTVTFMYGPFIGEMATLYMVTRYRFNWNEVQFSFFQTYSFLMSVIGTLISLLLFSKYLKWDDSVLGITSTTSKILAAFVYCFAPNSGIFYLGPLVDILSGAMLPILAIRSIYTKLISQQELGRLTSLFVLFENLAPVMYVPIYVAIYTATMDTLPGAIYLFGAAMTVPGLIAFMYLFRMHRISLKKKAMP
ncbi:solute carrier family 46 member 3-like isoform X1 [Manduca sexta]|uniref:solute carrier family 46 member 3-like isoform X1 n=2 Tax=Manduca sexta TaxID=7130 RepID=UPI00188F0117|nr:solute carrier family 46 member 3-like isoform X1 [Manduca sexta]